MSKLLTLHDTAMEYATRGWSVLPMHSINEYGGCSCGAPMDYWIGSDKKHAIGKHPYTEHGHKDASKEVSQISLWWKMWPEANIAIATGMRSRIVVLDIDAKNDGYQSLSQMERRHPLPETVRARSGGGGLHIYFKYPGKELRSRRGMRPGIDVMADGGKINAPPSRHKSGNRYEWVEGLSPSDIPIAPIPRWLLLEIETPRIAVKRRTKPVLWFAFG